MAIDPRIPLMAVPPRRNLLADAGNLMQLKAAQTQMQRGQQAYEREQMRRNALAQAYDPQTGQIDFQRGMGALGEAGDVEGALALRGTLLTPQAAELDMIEKRARGAARILGSIRSQEALDAAVPQIRALGFGEDAIAAAPTVYNEQTAPWFRAKEMEVLDVADRIKIGLQQESLAESKRAAGVSEARAAEKEAREREEFERKGTPAQAAVDTAFAKEYADFVAGGGFADVQKNVRQLQDVQKELKSGENLTGPWIGRTPDWAKQLFGAGKAITVRETVEEVVQRNLRLILGAQFTEREGERLIARAYNPNLPEAENAKRVGRLLESIQKAASAKISAANYYEKNGTLRGWKGELPNVGNIEASITDAEPIPLQGWSIEKVE